MLELLLLLAASGGNLKKHGRALGAGIANVGVLACLGTRGIALLTIIRALEKNPTAQSVLIGGVTADMVVKHFTGARRDDRVEEAARQLEEAGYDLG